MNITFIEKRVDDVQFKSLRQVLIWSILVLLGLFGIVQDVAAFGEKNRLESIGFSTLPGNRVQINLNFSQYAPRPIDFSTDNPARIVLDFQRVSLGLSNRSQPIGIGAVQNATAVETTDRTRVVLNLVRMVPFTIETIGNKLYVSLDSISSTSTVSPEIERNPLATSKLQAAQTVSIQQIPFADTPAVKHIDFRRTPEGAGRIMVTFSVPNVVVNMEEKGNNIVLQFSDVALPEKLDRKLDVIDFATPVIFVDTKAQNNNVTMTINVQEETESEEYDHLAYQSEGVYVIEIRKIAKEKAKELKKQAPVYKGQKVSFNFQQIDVRAALMLLTDLPGVNLNMVTSDAVQGTMSLRLKNVPWDQALDIILESQALGKRQVGNVLLIDLKDNIAKREEAELKAMKAIKELAPLRTEFIQINYAKAQDLESLIKSKTGDKTHSFLSSRGNVSVDERTNRLIIQDTADRLEELRNLIASLDTPSRQVLIESRVVIATDDFSRSLGVKFGYSANQDLGNGYGVVVGGKVAGDTQYRQDTAFSSGNTQGEGGQGENFIVRLPAFIAGSSNPASAVGLAIGKIGSQLLQLELSAMQLEGNGEIVSSPRVITGNQQTAVITQGSEIPVPGVAGVGAAIPTEFKEAVLQLEVTPQITPDDRVIMELLVKKDEPKSDGSISKREVKTKVLVDNGETVVLGGVYEQTRSQAIERVPFLSDIPFLGELFKKRFKEDKKSELLIFVTPKILKETS